MQPDKSRISLLVIISSLFILYGHLDYLTIGPPVISVLDTVSV